MAGDLRAQVLDGHDTNIRASVLSVGGLLGSQLVTLSDASGNYPTTTPIGGDIGLDVNVIGGTIAVTGTVIATQGARDITAEAWLTEEVPPTDFEGAPVIVGTTAVEITFAGDTKSIKIQSSYANFGRIYIGKSNVTSAGANATDELEPGDAVIMDLDDDTNSVWVVADIAAQRVLKKALV